MTGYVIVNVTLGRIAGFSEVYSDAAQARAAAERLAARGTFVFRAMELVELRP